MTTLTMTPKTEKITKVALTATDGKIIDIRGSITIYNFVEGIYKVSFDFYTGGAGADSIAHKSKEKFETMDEAIKYIEDYLSKNFKNFKKSISDGSDEEVAIGKTPEPSPETPDMEIINNERIENFKNMDLELQKIRNGKTPSEDKSKSILIDGEKKIVVENKKTYRCTLTDTWYTMIIAKKDDVKGIDFSGCEDEDEVTDLIPSNNYFVTGRSSTLIEPNKDEYTVVYSEDDDANIGDDPYMWDFEYTGYTYWDGKNQQEFLADDTIEDVKELKNFEIRSESINHGRALSYTAYKDEDEEIYIGFSNEGDFDPEGIVDISLIKEVDMSGKSKYPEEDKYPGEDKYRIWELEDHDVYLLHISAGMNDNWVFKSELCELIEIAESNESY